MGEKPGTLRIYAPSEIAGVSFGTHGLPLTVLADYLRTEVGCSIAMIGIQPSSVDFGEALSPLVERAVAEAERLLRQLVEHGLSGSR